MANSIDLSQIAAKIMPHRVSGAMNVNTYPTPPEVITQTRIGGGVPKVEAKFSLREGRELHSHMIEKDRRPFKLSVYAGTLQMPEGCIVCNGTAEHSLVVEAAGQAKVSFSGKLEINAPNAARMWTSLISDRYWYALPVCGQHKDKLKNSVVLVGGPKSTLYLKLPNKDWAQRLLSMNHPITAVYKSHEFIIKRRWTNLALYFGGFGTVTAVLVKLMFVFGVAAPNLSEPGWGWSIIFAALLSLGVYLLLNNPYENMLETEEVESSEGVKIG